MGSTLCTATGENLDLAAALKQSASIPAPKFLDVLVIEVSIRDEDRLVARLRGRWRRFSGDG